MSNFSPSSKAQLIWSIKNGEVAAVREEIDMLEFDVNLAINDRYPLHYAAAYGQLDVLRFLLSKGAAVNVVDSYGVSPLLAAIWEGHTKCVELLLKAGATRKGETPDGKTYEEAAESEEILKLLAG